MGTAGLAETGVAAIRLSASASEQVFGIGRVTGLGQRLLRLLQRIGSGPASTVSLVQRRYGPIQIILGLIASLDRLRE
jgi:hypothetical protein